jgi:ribosomal protein S18 acetylase RimI-like enzyme
MENNHKIIRLNESNIENEHICCAFSDKKCAVGYKQKKEWLKKQFPNGYVFKKINVRHKVFIEYAPAEFSWIPVTAPAYTHISCFWAAGQYKGKGFGQLLLEECIRDSKSKNGIIVVSSKKKKPYLADKNFFLKNGFELCDTAEPYFELLVRKNDINSPTPTFNKPAKENKCINKNGLTVYYSNQCPFTDYYVNIELKNIAENYNLPLDIIKIDSLEKAKNAPVVFCNYSLFYKDKFITHEIMNKNKFDKIFKNIKPL